MTTVLIGLSVALTGLVAFGHHEGSYNLVYSTAGPNTPFIRKDGTFCDLDEKSSDSFRDIGDTVVNLTFCFKQNPDGSLVGLPPPSYNDPLDEAATLYINNRTKQFVIPAADRAEAISGANEQLRQDRNNALEMGAATIAVIFFVSLIVGWIVRGFAGIPQGADHRTHERSTD